jgi:CDP-glucose 4,6-dehydratase
MEIVVIDPSFWNGRRVFLTGHTGFKGAWMSLLLNSLGAKVYGFALAPENQSGIFTVAGVANEVHHQIGDIREFAPLRDALRDAKPEIVIHMAAQALVRLSYAEPVRTYATNVLGTVHLLEAVRQSQSVEAVVVVTSDKCYENVGQVWGYREVDRIGGHDPYSNSKGCAELVTNAFRCSFFGNEGRTYVASGRAGNVIGGGDWAQDRLVPDAIRAFTAKVPLQVRNPSAVRPWQHVLDPVLAYLLLAERLVRNGDCFAEAWNFGPSAASEVCVERIVNGLVKMWGGGACWATDTGEHPHEAAYLKLDCSKAVQQLGWRPLIDLNRALELTAAWYKAQRDGADMRAFSVNQIQTVLSEGVAAANTECH